MSPLADKIGASLALLETLRAEHGAERVGVAWTAGKDSTVALHIWRRVLAEAGESEPALALSVDTGLKFPEIVEFRERMAARWGLRLVLARPDVDLAAYPVAVDKVQCCLDLKVSPLRRAAGQAGADALVTGLRRDEHPSRVGREALEQRPEQGYVQCNPLLEWTEMDIWAYLTGRELPWCALYDRGYRSLGCVPCTALPAAGQGERSGRDAAKEARLETLRSLGYF